MSIKSPSIHFDFTLEYEDRGLIKGCISRHVEDKSSMVFNLDPEYRHEASQFGEAFDTLLAQAAKVSRRLEKHFLTGRSVRVGVSVGYLDSFAFHTRGEFWAFPFARDPGSQILRAALTTNSQGHRNSVVVFPSLKVWSDALKEFYTTQITQCFEQESVSPVDRPDANLVSSIVSRGEVVR